MFAFMEGLPRAGKSYETCAYYIVPALLKGRTVVAYIEGLNHDKFAEVTGLPITIIKKLLIPITVEQVPEIYKYAVKDSLVIIDEMQDHWPSTRQPLGPEITTFITQHGHDGLDIIGMGQDLTDIHKLWRNRCARKIIFQKLDGVGRDGIMRGLLILLYVVRQRSHLERFVPVSESTKKNILGYIKATLLALLILILFLTTELIFLKGLYFVIPSLSLPY